MYLSAILSALILTTEPAAAAEPPPEPAPTCDCAALDAQVAKLTEEVDRLRGLRTLVSTDGVGKARWGMSPKQVKRKYPKLKETESGWMQQTSIAGLGAVQVFIYARDKLSIVGAVFTESYTNKNLHVNDYSKMKELLTKKYGEPASDDVHWSQDLYRGDAEHIGMALGMGHVRFITTWQTDKTSIELALHGNNFDVKHQVRYASRELEELQEQQAEAEKLDDL